MLEFLGSFQSGIVFLLANRNFYWNLWRRNSQATLKEKIVSCEPGGLKKNSQLGGQNFFFLISMYRGEVKKNFF